MAPDVQWWEVFVGLPVALQVFFYLIVVISFSSLASLLTLTVCAARVRHISPQGPDESEYLWVFVVAALNEEVTIADAVGRLAATRATHSLTLVMNDGSGDRTGEILAGMREPDLHVLTRVPPQARVGKAAALNHAYRYLQETLLRTERYAHWPADRIILGIVDADGRLDPDAPAKVARHFGDSRMGGVQCRVRIYNKRGYLTWGQDVEFSVFGLLFQGGRTAWGTANMGGCGQLNRLSALQTVADDIGPWRNKLTEDQDLGVRLIQSGWRGAQENSAHIDQQGLSSLRRLFRQRTRWAQGAWEALGLIGGTGKARVGVLASMDMVYYLLTPVLQLFTGVGLVAAIIVNTLGQADFWPAYLPVLVFFVTLGFGPGLIALMHRGAGFGGFVMAILLSVPYLLYTWLLFPVLVHSLLRHLAGRTAWSKTPREALEGAVTDDAGPAPLTDATNL